LAGNAYSSNLLTNSSCEKKDLSGWSSSGVTATSGGAANSWCFKFAANAFMSQTINPSIFSPTNPPDIRISAGFKIASSLSALLVSTYARIYLYVGYVSGKIDCFTIPCVAQIQYPGNVDGNWTLLSQDCILQTDSVISQVWVEIVTNVDMSTFYLDFISLQVDTGVSEYVASAVNESLPSLLYYTNSTVLTLNTTAMSAANLGIEAINDANIAINICMYIASAQSATVKIEIQLDQKNIPFSPLCQLLNGDNIIAIPIAIPQVAKGSHYIGLLLTLTTGTATIAINMLQIAIDGRYLAGGVSSEPPHAEIAEDMDYAEQIFSINENLTTTLSTPLSKSISDSITYAIQQFGISEGIPDIHLTAVATGSYFDNSDQSNFTGSYFVCDGSLHNVLIRDIAMTKTVGTSGNWYSAQLADSTSMESCTTLGVV
jgi:hypothetical protein